MIKSYKSMTFLIICILYGCPSYVEPFTDNSLKVSNKSDQTIVVAPVIKYNNNDTSLLLEDSMGSYRLEYVIEPDTFTQVKFSTESLQEILKNDAMMYFLFNKDTLDKLSWEEIVENNYLLRRYDFETWEDYERVNFTIEYP